MSKQKKTRRARALPKSKRRCRAVVTVQVEVWLDAHESDDHDDMRYQADIVAQTVADGAVRYPPNYRDPQLKGWRCDWKNRRGKGKVVLP